MLFVSFLSKLSLLSVKTALRSSYMYWHFETQTFIALLTKLKMGHNQYNSSLRSVKQWKCTQKQVNYSGTSHLYCWLFKEAKKWIGEKEPTFAVGSLNLHLLHWTQWVCHYFWERFVKKKIELLRSYNNNKVWKRKEAKRRVTAREGHSHTVKEIFDTWSFLGVLRIFKCEEYACIDMQLKKMEWSVKI